MEHWHSASIPSSSQQSERHALTTTSGNTKSYALESKDGIENQAPTAGHPLPGSVNSESIYPPPDRTLGSNDHQHAAGLHRLEARRRRHDARLDGRGRGFARSYLQHPEYIKYRSRARRDVGKDGKAVWDDGLEEAFQNALINIEPMGKKKRSQNNKPYGRNELIAEWIYHETGVIRDRKQVSSHIQVLNGLLKHVPSWVALTKAIEDETHGGSRNAYYENSIRDRVRQTRELHNHGSNGHVTSFASPSMTLGLDTEAELRCHLSGFSFHMWVSLPDHLEAALHNYTRVQSNQSSSAATPIENIRNWRRLFPPACALIEAYTPQDQYEIILLESSFQLMSDFPPSRSKLGIVLELSLTHPAAELNFVDNLPEWSYVTSMYQHGKLVNQAVYEHYIGSNPDKLRLDFEALWWAFTFTDLTEKKRRAEDSKNEATIQAASEASHSFFRGLTVVQEVFETPQTRQPLNQGSLGGSQQAWQSGRRIALLLWRFSQVQPGYVGTTTWRKLIPPPERRTTRRSPQPSHETALPPLVMDTVIEGMGDTFFESQDHEFLVQEDNMVTDPFYDPSSQQFVSHDAFPVCKGEGPTSFTTDFGMTEPELEQNLLHPSLSLANYNHIPPSLENQMQQGLLTAPIGRVGQMSDYFDAEIHRTLSQPILPAHHANSFTFTTMESLSQHACTQPEFGAVSPTSLYDESSTPSLRRPLASFNVSTHQNLQAQLNQSSEYPRGNVAVKETPLEALARRHQMQNQLSESPSALPSPERYQPMQYWLEGTRMDENGDVTKARVSETDFRKGSRHKSETEYLAPVPTRLALQSHASYLSHQEAGQLAEASQQEEQEQLEDAESAHEHDMNVNLEAFQANDLAAVLSAHNAEMDREAGSYVNREEETLVEQTTDRLEKGVEIKDEGDLVVIDLHEVDSSD